MQKIKIDITKEEINTEANPYLVYVKVPGLDARPMRDDENPLVTMDAKKEIYMGVIVNRYGEKTMYYVKEGYRKIFDELLSISDSTFKKETEDLARLKTESRIGLIKKLPWHKRLFNKF